MAHKVSSPYYPQSNGLAEMGVKMAKKLLRKVGTDKRLSARALQELRNTPGAEGYSPAQMMFQRRQRMTLPCHNTAYQPVNIDEAKRRRELTLLLRDLVQDERVIVQDPKSKAWEKFGVISKSLHNGRSYKILLDDGFQVQCNRRRVKPAVEMSGNAG